MLSAFSFLVRRVVRRTYCKLQPYTRLSIYVSIVCQYLIMKLCPTILGLVAVFLGLGEAQVTWPNAIDELEDVMFLNSGYRSRGFGPHVTPCSFSEFGAGRQTAAEWLRIGFHDMATTNVFFAPHGGIDGSIQFELNDGENIGLGFNTTLHTYSNFFNSQLPIADLIALGVYASVRTVRRIQFL